MTVFKKIQLIAFVAAASLLVIAGCGTNKEDPSKLEPAKAKVAAVPNDAASVQSESKSNFDVVKVTDAATNMKLLPADFPFPKDHQMNNELSLFIETDSGDQLGFSYDTNDDTDAVYEMYRAYFKNLGDYTITDIVAALNMTAMNEKHFLNISLSDSEQPGYSTNVMVVLQIYK